MNSPPSTGYRTPSFWWKSFVKVYPAMALTVVVDSKEARAEALVQRCHPRVTDACRAHLCVGGQIQATPTPFRTYPAAALWHEADGLHSDQPARILRCLKLATS